MSVNIDIRGEGVRPTLTTSRTSVYLSDTGNHNFINSNTNDDNTNNKLVLINDSKLTTTTTTTTTTTATATTLSDTGIKEFLLGLGAPGGSGYTTEIYTPQIDVHSV